jgi:hypothetical protein
LVSFCKNPGCSSLPRFRGGAAASNALTANSRYPFSGAGFRKLTSAAVFVNELSTSVNFQFSGKVDKICSEIIEVFGFVLPKLIS